MQWSGVIPALTASLRAIGAIEHDGSTLALSAPLPHDERLWFGHPRGLATLYFTELWERFSYYGMRAILLFFLIAPRESGGLGMDVRSAGLLFGSYGMSAFLFAIIGGFVGDRFLGARRAVKLAAFVIAAGHFTLALPSRATFFVGLVLVAVGSGLLKPNISTLVGSLYAAHDPRRDAGFSLFYMGINVGAFLGPLAVGFLAQSAAWKGLLASFGFDPTASWHWGFGAAGVGMGLGILWLRATEHRIAHIGNAPPDGAPRPWLGLTGVAAGSAALIATAVAADQPGWEWLRWLFVIAPVALAIGFGLRPTVESKRLSVLLVLFVAAMIFWSAFEQGASTLALFAERLTRLELFGLAVPASWLQSVGPLFVLTLAPLFAWLWPRLGERQPSSPFKFALGLAFMALSFALLIPAAGATARGLVSPAWLIGVFFLQTIGELCLSPVGLSAMTRLAPERLAGAMLGMWFLADALGNKLAGVLAGDFSSSDPAGLVAFFEQQTLAIAAAALAMFALTPLMRRWMEAPLRTEP
jgi:POT family proton-dependent oligopeptide transporter